MTAAKIYKSMPQTHPRAEWLARAKRFRAGPNDAARPPVHTQGTQQSCEAHAMTAAMEYLLGLYHKFEPLGAAELHSRFAGPNPPAIGDVFRELVENGVSGWKLEPPIYECGGFAGGFSAVLRRWPVMISTLEPVKPGPDGWVTKFKTPKVAHMVFGFKPARRGDEFGIWCMQSRGAAWSPETSSCFVLPESMITKAAIYAIRSVKRG